METTDKTENKSGKGTAVDRLIDIHRTPTVELIHKHLTKALCNEVFLGVRTTERQRKWSLFGLTPFWFAIILEPPPCFSHVRKRT